MLRMAIIGGDAEITEQLLPLLAEQSGHASSILGSGATPFRHLAAYPDGDKLERFVRASFPKLIFVSMAEPRKAEYIARWIKQFAPGTQIAGLSQRSDAETLRAALRAGMIDCLSFPIDAVQLKELLNLASQNLEAQPQAAMSRGKVISFLPSKPGVGCSTIALNVSMAIARRVDERVLLADFDLNLGLQGFMLKLAEVHSAKEAGDHAHHMDEEIWKALVANKGNLDVLGSGYVQPGQRLDMGATKELIAFCRRNYLAVCLDHSGNLERYSIELLMESDEIWLVSTSEIAPLHLAKTRMHLLREYGLTEKVNLIINRVSGRDAMTKEACEQSVGISVTQMLPNDYARVEAALYKGTHVDVASPLGQGIEALAGRIVPSLRKVEAEAPSRKLIEKLSLNRIFGGVSPIAALRDFASNKSGSGAEKAGSENPGSERPGSEMAVGAQADLESVATPQA